MNNSDKRELAETIAGVCPRGYYVGGLVRDSLAGRFSTDIDIALERSLVKQAARALAQKLNGAAFEMDAENCVWRVTVKDPFLQIDLSALTGASIEEDLPRRDFTVNAMAYPVGAPCSFAKASGKIRLAKLKKANLIDPCGGEKDLRLKRINAGNPRAFIEDPLRLLRAFRVAAELGFKITPPTKTVIRENAALITSVSGERIREELLKILACPHTRKNLTAMDKAGLLTALFPELEKQKGCAPQYYGKGGVFTHTLLVVDRLEYLLAHLKEVFPAFHLKLKQYADQAALLKFAALLHDISKPETAKVIGDRLRFFHHEAKGAKRTEDIMRALRFSRAETQLAAAIIAEHLRPGNLAANRVITPRAVYRFFNDMGESAVPMLLVCWADHTSYIPLAKAVKILPLSRETPAPVTCSELPDKGVKKTLRHMQVIHLMLWTYFKNPKSVLPDRIITGTDLMAEFKLAPGPEIGRILEEVRTAQAEGKVKNRADALAYAAKLVKPA